MQFSTQQVFNGRLHMLDEKTGSYYPVPLGMDDARLKQEKQPINVYQVIYINGISHCVTSDTPMHALKQDLESMLYMNNAIQKVDTFKESNVVVNKVHPLTYKQLSTNYYNYRKRM